ncbi:MAG: AAA family ATPase [Deltaproteobacteria bacterium]|nr:AAA family ATPase [Deltaproteobacteria bacterium]
MIDYLSFYKFREDPFGITPDPEFFYPSKSHLLALESMDYFLKKGEGFMLVTGGPGTGKTTLIRTFLKGSVDAVFPIVIYNPVLKPEDLLTGIVQTLSVSNPKSLSKSKFDLISTLKDHLFEKRKMGYKNVLILDEAQDIPNQTLNEIKHLSNLETDKEKLLNIILLSQPFFERTLSDPTYAQINQRITLRVKLDSLDKDGTEDYIRFRLQKAGAAPILFDKGAIKLIHKASKGIPRLINLICSRTLMVGYLKGSYRINKSFVKLALKHLHL